MSRSLEDVVASIIPRHNGSLPSELVELASSFVAQSRSQAGNLKSDEEIGRTFACAHIACERLKQQLNLPTIEPQPPLPPKTYNKLYNYFNSILKGGRKRGRPARPQSLPAGAETNHDATPRSHSRPVPTKSQSLKAFQSPGDTILRSAKKGLLYDNKPEVPSWIYPTTRQLCKKLEAPAAMPHIVSGVSSIVSQPSPQSLSSEDGIEKGSILMTKSQNKKLPALIVAVYIFCRTRLLGKETKSNEYIQLRNQAIRLLDEAKAEVSQNPRYADMNWEDWNNARDQEVDSWILKLPAQGWLTLDWFLNMVEGSGLITQDEEDEEDEKYGGNEDGNNEAGDNEDGRDGNAALTILTSRKRLRDNDGDRNVLRGGLGTMMRDRFDYLTDAKRASYQEWEKSMKKKIGEEQKVKE